MPADTRSTKEVSEIVKQSVNNLFNDTWKRKLIEKITDTVSDEINTKLNEIEEKINNLEQQVLLVTEQNKNLQAENEKLEQYSRRNSLRIMGIEEGTNENTENIVLQLLANKLTLSVLPEHVDRCHRVGDPRKGMCRPIIIKFTSYRYRNMVFMNKKKLQGTKITIKEDLTKFRLNLYKKACEEFHFKNVWTQDGTVFVKNKKGRTAVRNIDDIVRLKNLPDGI